MSKFSTFAFLLLSLVLLNGCSEDVDSEDIRTSGIYAAMDLEATADNHTGIQVALKVGGSNSNTYLNLTAGDTLTATLNDSEETTLSKVEDSSGEINYTGAFSSASAGTENSIIKIAFNRNSADTSAPNSLVTLPAAPSGLTTDKTNFNRGTESVILTWDASNTSSNMSLDYEGSCISDGSATVVDNGIYTINAGTIKDSSQQSCSVTFTLSRSVSGTLDPAFGEGGYIRAKQSRSISVTSAP